MANLFHEITNLWCLFHSIIEGWVIIFSIGILINLHPAADDTSQRTNKSFGFVLLFKQIVALYSNRFVRASDA